jgi:hypothetical protein
MSQPDAPSKERKYQETLYLLFQQEALEDQRKYYANSVRRYRKSATEVNRLRALFAFLTGVSSALAGLIAAVYLSSLDCTRAANAVNVNDPGVINPGVCGAAQAVVAFLTIMAIVAPAIGAAFTTLADIFQWDRLTSIYQTALENLEVADATSPIAEMDDVEYRASLRAFAEGALEVMRNETAQWGQTAQAPVQLERFIREEREKAARLNASADDYFPDREETDSSAGGGTNR